MCTAMAGDVNAEDIETGSMEDEMQEAAQYDLEKGGTQSFEMLDENGECSCTVKKQATENKR